MMLKKLKEAEGYLAKAINTDYPVLLMASGGSAISLLTNIELKNNVTLTVLDERYEGESNFKQVSHLTNRSIDPSPAGGESLEETASRFENNIRGWKNNNPNGKIIITQGMGDDGHTAGIFPGFEETDNWVIGYEVNTNKFPKRITVTPTFLRNEVDVSIVYISGESKKEQLERVLSVEGSLSKTPARIIREMQNAIIFTDINLS